MRWGSANICPQRAHGGDQDQGVGLLPLLKIPNSLRRPRGPPLSALGVAGSRPPCGRPGLPVAGTWGEGSPRCHAAPVHLRPCGLRPQGQPLIGGTSGTAATPSSKAAPGRSHAASPPPRRPPTPPHMPSHRIAPSPTSRGRAAPGSQRPRYPYPGGPILPPALAPAWPPGGLSRVAASRLAVPRPASLQRHRASPNRHPARQPGRAPEPLRTSRRSQTESCAAAAAADPLCPLPDPRAVPSLLPGPSQGSAHARPARSHLARMH